MFFDNKGGSLVHLRVCKQVFWVMFDSGAYFFGKTTFTNWVVESDINELHKSHMIGTLNSLLLEGEKERVSTYQ